MAILGYIKKHGILHAIQVFYKYKLNIIYCKFINLFFKNKKLLNMIIIESHNDFDCNGGAFYDYLVKNNYNEKYKIIWLLKNKKRKLKEKNVKQLYLFKPSFRKAYYICRAKFFTFDNTYTAKIRPDQITIYFTHGAVSLKNCYGQIHIPDAVNYILSPSKNYDEVLCKQYGILYPDTRFIHPGFPCHDVLYQDIPNELEKITTKKYNKIILWMPTFRKGGGYKRNDSLVDQRFGIPLIDTEEELKLLQDFLKERNNLLIIKIHPKQDLNTIKSLYNQENIIILTGKKMKDLNLDNYRLFKSCDAIISDYSAVAFSFLLLNKPIGFILSDLKEYKLGVSVENIEDYLVGPSIYTFEDFVNFVDDVDKEKDTFAEKREELIDFLYKYKDGNSCKRIVEILGLDDERESVKASK
ncbi:MAG: teichoic acid biosynthesis protein TagF [Acholeplasmatales bacterium]|uniref:CDP-glycerol glycerophosphotransferase family protein n=1 Tax=Thomasclavelia cocleata TaxID=69824 RepID=UPI00258B986C|nr:CDP-glycerol glycerophosphotransferase family protein [Thomasclavelia cocleata]MCI9182838.1 teichoic acid biosynthesis protein TagF [Acholeplasmatales bacterium]